MEVYIHFINDPWFNRNRKEDYDELELFIRSCSSSLLIQKKVITFHDDLLQEILLMKQEMKLKYNDPSIFSCLDQDRAKKRLLLSDTHLDLSKYFKYTLSAANYRHSLLSREYNKQQVYKMGLFYLIKKLRVNVDMVKKIRRYLY